MYIIPGFQGCYSTESQYCSRNRWYPTTTLHGWRTKNTTKSIFTDV